MRLFKSVLAVSLLTTSVLALLSEVSFAQATTAASAELSAGQAATSVSADSATTLDTQARYDKLIDVALTALSKLAQDKVTPEFRQRFDLRVKELVAKAIEHRLPLPVGVSVGFDTDAGFGVGGDIGTEFLFLMQDNGNIGFGVFPFIDAEVGAGAILSRGIFVDFVFNLDKVSDYAGAAIGVTADIGFIADGGGEIACGVDKDDLAAFKQSFKQGKSLYQKASELEATITKADRSCVVGFGLAVGAGSKIMGFGRVWKEAYEAVVADNKADLEAQIIYATSQMKNFRHEQFVAMKSSVRHHIEKNHEERRERRVARRSVKRAKRSA